MPTYEAKIKLNETVHSVTWDIDDKISIPDELTAALTSEEMIQLIIALRALKFWMDNSSKKTITIERDED